MKNEIAVSIIVPVYNVEAYLKRCMSSLLGQSLKNIEIIMVDDGSTDNSGAICDEYAAQNDNVRVIHKQNGGLGYARNSGLDVAQGEFIGFVDSDDFVDDTMYELLYSAAKESGADYVRCRNAVFLEQNNQAYSSSTGITPGLYSHDDAIKQMLYPMLGKSIKSGKEDYIGVSVWRAIYRRSIIEEHNIRFLSERDIISEDIPFNLDYLTHADTAYAVDAVLYYYVMRDGSLTKTFRPDRFDKEIALNRRLTEKAQAYNIFDDCRIRLKRMFLDRSRRYIKSLLQNSDYSTFKKLKTTKQLLRSPYLADIFKDFPINELPTKYKIVAYLMKYKCATIMLLLANKL